MSANKDILRPADAPSTVDSVERRRIGRIVRDDRDTATVEWLDAPADYERMTLSIETTIPAGTVRPQVGYDPYATTSPQRAGTPPEAPARPVKRDLRKLSEWIKQMRELEERKKRGEE